MRNTARWLLSLLFVLGFAFSGCNCGDPDDCEPVECSDIGKECGVHPDGCEGTIECGTCEEGYECEEGICIDTACSPNPCTNPPSPECNAAGDGVIVYGETGECEVVDGEVECTYASSVEACDAGYTCWDAECISLCGNDTIDEGEVCDGTDLGGKTCADFDLMGDGLACADDCMSFDISGCEPDPCYPNPCPPGPGAECGTGEYEGSIIVYELEGVCEVIDGNTECSYPYTASPCEESRVCDGDTVIINTGACVEEDGDAVCEETEVECDEDHYCSDGECLPLCGNNVIDEGEVCDGTDLDGMTCEDFGLLGDGLACSPDCQSFDVSACEVPCIVENIDYDLGYVTGEEVATGSTVGETADHDPSCILSTEEPGPDLAFLWSAPESGCYVIDTVGSDFNTVLSVKSCENDEEMVCNRNIAVQDEQSRVRITAWENQSYVIIVGGATLESEGDYVLNIQQESDGSCCDFPAQAVLGTTELEGSFSSTMPSGTFSCIETFTNIVWFEFTASETGVHEISAVNNTGTFAYSRLAVLEDSSCSPLSDELICATANGKTITENVLLHAGNTYLIAFGTDGATYTMVDPEITIVAPGGYDTCNPNPCAFPPEATCTPDGLGIITYPAFGDCVDENGTAECTYDEHIYICNEPPVSHCDGSVFYWYDEEGSCGGSPAECIYVVHTEDCGAVDDICTPDGCVTPVEGDFCEGPIVIDTGRNQVTGDFSFSLPSDTFSCDPDFANAVWFEFTASETGEHFISAINYTTTFAWSRMAILDGTSCNPYDAEVACLTNNSKQVEVFAELQSGNTYLIVFATDGASFTMIDPEITVFGPTEYAICEPNPCDSPPPDECNGDGTGIISYSEQGICDVVGGVADCTYDSTVEYCDSPPDNYCDGSVYYWYDEDGICGGSPPECSYTEFTIDCDDAGEVCTPYGCMPSGGETCDSAATASIGYTALIGNFTDEPDESMFNCTTAESANVVWFEFTASESGGHEIRAENKSPATASSRIAVYDGTICDPLGEELICATLFTRTITRTIALEAGESYLIAFATNVSAAAEMVDPVLKITGPGGYSTCSPNPCTNPPEASCSDGTEWNIYSDFGDCEDDNGNAVCTYEPTVKTCDDPPDSYCEGSVYYWYDEDGICGDTPSECIYDLNFEDCDSVGGSCTLVGCVVPDDGELCENPYIIEDTGTTSVSGEFTHSLPSDTFSCDPDFANAVWFEFAASETGEHFISARNNTTTLAWSRMVVLEGTSCDPYGAEVECKSANSKVLEMTPDLQAGSTYLIVFATDGDNYTMIDPEITIVGPTEYAICEPNPCENPPPAECTVDGFGIITFPDIGECEAVDGAAECTYDPITVDCDSPPESECVGSVFTWYDEQGICGGSPVECIYEVNTEDCSLAGEVCTLGGCVVPVDGEFCYYPYVIEDTGTTSVSGEFTHSLPSDTFSCHATFANVFWFEFTPEDTGTYEIVAENTTNLAYSRLVVLDGISCDPHDQELECQTANSRTITITVDLEAGLPYLFAFATDGNFWAMVDPEITISLQ